ncbi:MAG: alpha/beta hydrolase, partial [Clostridia bacterium]|nr:alpha/beta hydrolase [Clostridia bacterium]
REGEPVALAFMPYCFNAFVLNYSVGDKARFPKPLIEASLAMKHIKDNAEEYGIDKDRVFVTGFSAGGHLCTALGTLWHMPEIYEQVEMEFGYNKPKAIIPVYPVICSDPEVSHRGSFYNIVGEGKQEEEYEKYSLDMCVDEKSVPAFIVHTADDKVVNVRNSIRLANAYSEKGIPFELHIFKEAPHGMALSNKITGKCQKHNNSHNAKWVELAAEWMEAYE